MHSKTKTVGYYIFCYGSNLEMALPLELFHYYLSVSLLLLFHPFTIIECVGADKSRQQNSWRISSQWLIHFDKNKLTWAKVKWYDFLPIAQFAFTEKESRKKHQTYGKWKRKNDENKNEMRNGILSWCSVYAFIFWDKFRFGNVWFSFSSAESFSICIHSFLVFFFFECQNPMKGGRSDGKRDKKYARTHIIRSSWAYFLQRLAFI